MANKEITRRGLIEIVKDVSGPIADNFGLPLQYEGKGGETTAASAVTAIDRELQYELMRVLPGNFMGEEEGERLTGAEYAWLVDPVDGTGARIRGLPSSTCIVTRMRIKNGAGYPVLTVIHNPITDQTWSAAECEGAFYQLHSEGERKCQFAGDHNLLANEKILTTVSLWPGDDYRFEEVKRAVEAHERFDNQDFGALGMAHATVLSGTTHVSASRGGTAYETAAATLLMKEAGGVAWNLEGNSLIHPWGSFPIQNVRRKRTFVIPKGSIISSNERVALEFLELVRKVNRS